MGLITRLYSYPAGTLANGVYVQAEFQQIIDTINGNIVDANIAAGAAIQKSKISGLVATLATVSAALGHLTGVTSASVALLSARVGTVSGYSGLTRTYLGTLSGNFGLHTHAAGVRQIPHANLSSVTADQHHAGFVGISGSTGSATPSATDTIRLSGAGGIATRASGSVVVVSGSTIGRATMKGIQTLSAFYNGALVPACQSAAYSMVNTNLARQGHLELTIACKGHDFIGGSLSGATSVIGHLAGIGGSGDIPILRALEISNGHAGQLVTRIANHNVTDAYTQFLLGGVLEIYVKFDRTNRKFHIRTEDAGACTPSEIVAIVKEWMDDV